MASDVREEIKAGTKDTKGMDLKSFNVCRAENGYKICANYEKKNKTISQRAGWVPSCSYDDKQFVYKTDEEVLTAVKAFLKEIK